jgi:ABC-2 type transport system ATP-binding protein
MRARFGLVPQELAFYDNYSARDNVRFFGSLYGLRGKQLTHAVDEALAFVGLEESQKKSAKSFSGGMKRRLNIACGIVHSPELVIMDEPTVGIDPQSRNHILASIEHSTNVEQALYIPLTTWKKQSASVPGSQLWTRGK